MSAGVEVTARQVFARVTRGRPWLGLTVEDVVAQAHVEHAEGKRGPALYWALRRYVYAWLDGDRHTGARVVAFPVGYEVPDRADDARGVQGDASALVARLSPDRRAIVTAIYRDGMSPQDAAVALGMPVQRVRAQRYRAVEQLKAWAGRPSPAYLTERTRSLAALATLAA